MRGALATLCVLAMSGAPALAQQASLQSLDKELVDVVERVAPSVVHIGNATGVCVSEKGHILTDIQVAIDVGQDPKKMVEVAFPDQKRYLAQLVEKDPETKSALFRIDVKQKTFPAVRPGNPGALQVGHLLLTIGNSFGSAEESEPAVTLGVLSAVHRDEKGAPRVLETSAATNPGQEGGPYFNADGDLMGIERDLPTSEDLATISPIERIIADYAQLLPEGSPFQKPRALAPPKSQVQILSRAFAIAAERARKGVVTLVITRRKAEPPAPSAEAAVATAPAPEPEAPLVPVRMGPVTGTILDAKGFVIASSPPFATDIESIEALLADGRRLRATQIARDEKAGLVLLLLDKGDGEALPVLDEAPSGSVRLGQFVAAIGAPHGPPAAQDAFATFGILSAQHQLDAYRDALQTDAGVNVKNAGGPIVDLRGRMLGIALPPGQPFGQNSGLGFAIPLDALRAVLPAMMAGRSIEPAMVGVLLGDVPGGGGARIESVSPGMPAEVAGVKAGDQVVLLDGTKIRNRREFADFMAKNKSAGDTLKLGILRDGKPLELSLVLIRRK